MGFEKKINEILKFLMLTLVAAVFMCGFKSYASEATFTGFYKAYNCGNFDFKVNRFLRDTSYITDIIWSDTLPSDGVTVINVDEADKGDIKAWVNGDVLYLYTEADKVYMPQNSSKFLYNFSNLNTLDFLSRVDASRVTNLEEAFEGTSKLIDASGIADWDTSNVTNMNEIFSGMAKVTNLDFVSKWNTSKVTDLAYAFSDMEGVTNLDALSNWDTSNVTTLESALGVMQNLSNIDGISNWNTHKVTTLYRTFFNLDKLTNLDALSNWDTSNVTNMDSTFCCDSYYWDSDIENLDGIKNWNTSKVTTMKNI